MTFHASGLCREPRKIPRLDPPEKDAPGHGVPSGAGSAAVIHSPCCAGGSRCRNSPRFHGPVIHIATFPRANSW